MKSYTKIQQKSINRCIQNFTKKGYINLYKTLLKRDTQQYTKVYQKKILKTIKEFTKKRYIIVHKSTLKKS